MRIPPITCVASSVLVLAVLAAPAATQAVYDDFNNGTTIDPKLWYFNGSPTISQSNGKLQIRMAAGQGGQLESTDGFQGSFDFQLDFSILSGSSTSGSLYLGVYDALPPNTDDGIDIGVTGGSSGQTVTASAIRGGQRVAWGTSGPLTNGSSGVLRLQLSTMGQLSAQYRVGGGAWVSLFSYPNFMGNWAQIWIETDGGNGSFNADCDWIQSNAARLSTAPNPYGAGCQGLDSRASYFPFVGTNAFGMVVRGAKPQAALSFILGSSNQTWAGLSLPLDLTFIGAPGCFLNASADLVLPGTTDPNGELVMPLPIPNNPWLLGWTLHSQFVVAATSGLSSSNGVTFTIL